MRIIKSKDGSTFMCHMNGQSFQSGNREYVEEWRDVQIQEQSYDTLYHAAVQAYYDDTSFNYKGD